MHSSIQNNFSSQLQQHDAAAEGYRTIQERMGGGGVLEQERRSSPQYFCREREKGEFYNISDGYLFSFKQPM